MTIITKTNSAKEPTKSFELEDLHIFGNKAEEREVTVTKTADEKIIHIYTSDDTYLTKIKKLVASNPKSWKIVKVVLRPDGSVSGIMAEAPQNALSFRAATSLSDDEKKIRSERMRGLSKK